MTLKINSDFTHTDYEIINRSVPYEGEGWMRLAQYQLRFRLFDGKWSKIISREVLERPGAAAILPYDPLLDKIILIEQFRIGALASPDSPWIIEIVAGLLDTAEKPEQVAHREAKEEAGCHILDIYRIGGYFVSPGGSNEFMHLYCGRINASQSGGIFGLEKENEDIRAFTLSTDEAFALLKEGRLKTPPAIISLQWLQLNKAWLKQLWET